MPRISVDDVKAWVENTKLNPQALDIDYISQIEEEILARLSSVYDTSTWVDKASTPRLIQVIIAKMYSGWIYDKYYSENQSDPNKYAQLLKMNAESLIVGILEGTIEIPGVTATNPAGASFYPNDSSSSIDPNTGFYDPRLGLIPSPDDTSVGPAKFSMGRVF